MATFKCQTCGNLHGAPVEACGVCGSPAVAFEPEPGAAPAPGASPPPAAALPPEVVEMFAAFTGQIRERDDRRDEHHAALDEAETERRERVTVAAVALLESLTRLADGVAVAVANKPDTLKPPAAE